MLKLKLQSFGHLIQRINSLEKTLMLVKIKIWRKSEQERIRWLGGIIDSTDMDLSKLWEMVKDREVWRGTIQGFTKIWTLNDDLKFCLCVFEMHYLVLILNRYKMCLRIKSSTLMIILLIFSFLLFHKKVHYEKRTHTSRVYFVTTTHMKTAGYYGV